MVAKLKVGLLLLVTVPIRDLTQSFSHSSQIEWYVQVVRSLSSNHDADLSPCASSSRSGYQFTHKLEGMFGDMQKSFDVMVAFKSHLAKTTVRPFLDLYPSSSPTRLRTSSPSRPRLRSLSLNCPSPSSPRPIGLGTLFRPEPSFLLSSSKPAPISSPSTTRGTTVGA